MPSARRQTDVDDSRIAVDIESDPPVDDLDQQENISLSTPYWREWRREDTVELTVSVRQPGMKGKQRAFDADTHRYQHDRHDQRNLILAGGGKPGDRFFHVAHEQLSVAS